MLPDSDTAEPSSVDRPSRPEIDLSLTVVEYTDGPDRCTVFPPGLSGDAHLSTWLSVDRSLVVSLPEIR